MMTDYLIRLALSNFSITCFLITLILTIVVLPLHRKPITRLTVADTLLRFYILFTVGVSQLYNFIMHVFFGDFVAQFIGWSQSPFQAEVGFCSLGFALIGFYAYRKNLSTRVCAILGPAAFLWGAAIGHIHQMVVAHNFAIGNAGPIYYADLIQPALGFLLLIWYDRAQKQAAATPKTAGF